MQAGYDAEEEVMSAASAARRLAATAAVGGGGLGLLGGTLYGVLRLEASLARRTIGNADETPPDPSGVYGASYGGLPLRLSVLGDSAAAGYGASVPDETFGAFLADGLATLAQRPVLLQSLAVVGARTTDLTGQIAEALPHRPDVVAMIIGANDVTHRVRPSASVAALREAVTALRSSGDEETGWPAPQVVVGTCPDLGTVKPIPPPLRQVARRWSQRLAAAQTVACVESGGSSVSLGSLLGPNFSADPHAMFGPDRFHPSVAGYRSCAIAMLPTVASAVGALPEDGKEPEAYRVEGVFALARAAAAAAQRAGTEVSQVADADGGAPAGRHGRRAAMLRRRRRTPVSHVETTPTR
jgi:lysophospholipase L1-like esterase